MQEEKEQCKTEVEAEGDAVQDKKICDLTLKASKNERITKVEASNDLVDLFTKGFRAIRSWFR